MLKGRTLGKQQSPRHMSRFRRDRLRLSSKQQRLFFGALAVGACVVTTRMLMSATFIELEPETSFSNSLRHPSRADRHKLVKSRNSVPQNDGATLPLASTIRAGPMVTNSAGWLNGSRIANIDEGDLMSDEMLAGLLFPRPVGGHGPQVALQRTICHNNSRFMNWDNTAHDTEQELDRRARGDAVRLMYLVIHENQHAPARKEAMSRAATIMGGRRRPENVGKFDFECLDAKFIVTWLQENGLGDNVRLRSIDSVFLGVATGRVTLFLNKGPHLPKKMKRYAWRLASCERHDHQCFFMPMSPCVITMEELLAAPILNVTELVEVRSTGRFHPRYENERVVVVPPNREYDPPMPFGCREVMHRKAMSFSRNADTLDTQSPVDKLPRLSWTMEKDRLERAGRIIRNETDRLTPIYAALAYNLRPNLRSQQRMKSIMDELFPKDFDPSKSLGLAIRSSDRCVGNMKENTCISFSEYIRLAIDYSKEQKATSSDVSAGFGHDTIIITSESQEMLDAALHYGTNISSTFRVILNRRDVAQGTGSPAMFHTRSKNVSADDIMLSTMIAFQMQLQATDIMLNCCSYFHGMIKELAMAGCGAVDHPKVVCQRASEQSDCMIRNAHVSN